MSGVRHISPSQLLIFKEVRKCASADLVKVTHGNNGGIWMYEDVAIVQPLVQLQDHKAVTTSKLVATAFGKQHKHVLRDIESLECSENFRVSNFGHTPFTHPQNKHVYSMYTVTFYYGFRT